MSKVDQNHLPIIRKKMVESLGEKVKLSKDNEVAILIEAKKFGDPLNENLFDQIAAYFVHTQAELAVLTNGVIGKWFTPKSGGKLDPTPIFELNLKEKPRNSLDWLLFSHRDHFNRDQAQLQSNLERNRPQLKKWIETNLMNPSEDFCRFVIKELQWNFFNPEQGAQIISLIQETIQRMTKDYSFRPVSPDPKEDPKVNPEIRWSLDGKKWTEFTRASSLYIDLLQLLDKNHSQGTRNWCKTLSQSKNNYFSLMENPGFTRRSKLGIKGAELFSINIGLNNSTKGKILKRALKMTIIGGKTPQLGKDNFIEFPNSGL